MNYPDEDYVRYYTRETVSWRALGWEGQVVLALMLHGRFDRSGVFDCDGHQPSHAVTLVTGVPADVAEVGLARLLEAKTWMLVDGRIVWPKFVEAQSCRRTDRARQEESRRNRRDSALTPLGDIGDEQSQSVTRLVSASPLVTPSRAEQSQAEEGEAPRERRARPDLAPPDFLRSDWRPDPESVEVLAAETQSPPELILRQRHGFVDYWTRGKGKTKRRKLDGWRQSWMRWVRTNAADGRLGSAPPLSQSDNGNNVIMWDSTAGKQVS